MIRFVHTADIHFGMENYGKIDPVTGIHTRLLDFERALQFCIDRAIDNQVDFFLFSGDAYKTAHPTPTHQRLLLSCFLRLFEHKIPLVIIVGNHDHPLSFGKAHALELFGQIPLDGFHVIAKPSVLTLKTKQGPVNIVGIPWPSRANIALTEQHAQTSSIDLATQISEAVSSKIEELARSLPPQVPAVLAGHLTVSSGVFSGSEKRAVYGSDPVLLPSQLAIPPFDYVALGHLHRYQNLNSQGHPAVVYSGSIERVDFGERKEEKGFCLVTIHDKERTEHQFIPTPSRPFIQIEVELHDRQSQTEQIIAELRKHKLQEAVLKIIYHLPRGVTDKVDMVALHNVCTEAHYLVGIFPVRPVETKVQRANARLDMNLEQLLEAYCATQPQLKEQQSALIKKARQLENELGEREL